MQDVAAENPVTRQFVVGEYTFKINNKISKRHYNNANKPPEVVAAILQDC